MTWYEDFFASAAWADVQRARYTAESATEIAGAMVNLLGLEPGDAVLDVPCGAGPIAVPLAQRGMEVTGVDFSAERLGEARAAAEAGSVTLELLEADMRALPWEARFDAAINYWGSFGYFDDAGNEAFARAVCRALKPGGRFLIEIPSLETIAAAFQPEGTAKLGDIEIHEVRRYDYVTGVLDDDWTFVRGGEKESGRTSIRMYSCVELANLLRRAGFSSFAPYATLAGRPFELGARLHLVATK